MNSSRVGLAVRISLLAGLVGLLGLILTWMPGTKVQAEAGQRPLLQDTAYPVDDVPSDSYPVDDGTSDDTGYPGMTETSSASAPTNTLAPNVTPGTSTVTFTATVTPLQTQTPTLTATLPPDAFRTEDSEMNGALVTPSTSETPAPTITAYVSPTLETAQAQATDVRPAAQKKGGLPVDWGMFWIGFSVPVLAACGFILYLLDRRPDLFKPSH